MSKKAKSEAGKERILNAWNPPADAGDPIGCLATSFTFHADFFEEECLARFLRLQSDPSEDGPAYLCEREERLAGLCCAAAIVDGHHARGRRNLRWDLLPLRLNKGILHAKISLLRWSNCVRIIVASANLTKDGYRRNREVFVALDYTATSDSPRDCLRDIIPFLREIVVATSSDTESASPAAQRCLTFLDKTLEATHEWGAESTKSSGTRIHAILSGLGRGSVFEQIHDQWPGTPPSRARIVSPFFDVPGHQNLPAEEVWNIMRQRGNAYVEYLVEKISSSDEGVVALAAPEELNVIPRESCEVKFTLLSQEAVEAKAAIRPLHMKAIYLDNENIDDWNAYLLGSSNFTSAGLGLRPNCNIEANLLFLSKDPVIIRRLAQSWPKSEKIRNEIRFIEEKQLNEDDAEGAPLALPFGFGTAVYGVTPDKEAFVTLELLQPEPGWTVVSEQELPLYSAEKWSIDGCPHKLRLKWTDPQPPSGLWVSINDGNEKAWWPVNIDSTMALLPPEQLRGLSLDVLIHLLSSARPLHEAMKQWLHAKDNAAKQAEGGSYDPHKKVNTSNFLMQRTRRVSWALNGMRERLSRPHPSAESLEWRLRGPVGVTAVRDAILQTSGSASERAFLLAELALELSRVIPTTFPGYLAADEISASIASMKNELCSEISMLASAVEPGMRAYIECAKMEAMK